MRTIASALAAAAILLGSQLPGVHAQNPGHVLQSASEAQWAPAPPMLPPGSQMAVLSGDPGKAAPFSIRVKMPANYAVPAHSHPTDENVVVVSGALTFGMGDRLQKGLATNKKLGAGGYAFMPAHMNHFVYTAQPTTIVIYGTGPVDFKYVNPADDPRNAKTKK